MLNYLRVPVINAGKICFAVTCVTFSQSAVCCGRGTTFKCLDDLRIHIWRDLEMFAVYINMVKGVRKEWGMYRNVTREDVWIYRELYGRSQQVFGCVWIVFGILKQAIYGDICLRSAQFGEKTSGHVQNMSRNVVGFPMVSIIF